jgi:chemotaxis protein methyltransferase CheR
VKESHLEREFPMSQKNFDEVKDIAYRLTGIKLTDHKKNMIYSRLARRIRERGLGSFNEYCDLLGRSGNDETTEFVNAITTNLTSFFRENHHFEYLVETVFPELIKKNSASRRVRVWSAGCSTGEEPYSIAICLREHMPVSSWDVKLLATDLDTNVVAHGKRGVYHQDRIESMDPTRIKKWFLRENSGSEVRVK